VKGFAEIIEESEENGEDKKNMERQESEV